MTNSKGKPMTLKQAFETMLTSTINKLTIALIKNNKWDIKHYASDIKFIEDQLNEIN